LDFSGNDIIVRIETEIKNTPNMGGIPEVLGEIHFGPLTLKITQII